MYEAIRTKSVHTMANASAGFPHRSREEELDIQLAGHLSALLVVTDEIRAAAPGTGLDTGPLDAVAERLAAQVARLRSGSAPVRADGAGMGAPERVAALRGRAHALAGRALVVAASRADTSAAILAAECMDLHAEPLGAAADPAAPRVPAAL